MSNITVAVPALGNKFVDDRLRVAGDSFTWDFPRTTNQIKFVAVHHSVTNHIGVWKDQVDLIAKLHTSPPPQGRGWGGIGYHFVVCSDGTVAYVGDVGMARANVSNLNDQVIGVCLVGDFTKILPTDAQIHGAHELISVLLNPNIWPNLKSWANVVGHKELDATACPGTIWKGPADSLYERIKNDIPYTPPVPTISSTASSTITVVTPPLTTMPTSTTTVPPITLPPPTPAGEAFRMVANIMTGRGWWWVKYAKVRDLVLANKHLWET